MAGVGPVEIPWHEGTIVRPSPPLIPDGVMVMVRAVLVTGGDGKIEEENDPVDASMGTSSVHTGLLWSTLHPPALESMLPTRTSLRYPYQNA